MSNDLLVGTEDDDVLVGLGDDDTLTGLGGNDWLQPGSGNDLVDGGVGANDVVSYAEDPNDAALIRGIDLDLATGSAIDGWNDTDTLVGIEEAIGTTYADRMSGDSADNAFAGRAGDDTLLGVGGHDWLRPGSGTDSVDGGAGYDTVTYEDDDSDPGESQGVVVDLAANEATDGWNDTDTLIGIEAVVGSSRSDRVTGDAAGNDLQGNAGNDTLIGGGGDDYLKPGRGNDWINGGADVDTLSYILVWSDPVALQGATVDLDAGTVVDPWGGSDHVAGIEIVKGSALADSMRASDNGGSTLEGRFGNDTLLGGAADDWLQPGRGADSIDGGADHDWVSYVEDDDVLASQGVVVNLLTGSATDGWGAHDTLLAMENAVGSMLNDRLTGLGPYGRLAGRGGNDTLAGGEADYESDPAGVFVNLSLAAVTYNGTTVNARRAIDGYGDTDTFGAGVVSGYGSADADVWFSDDHDVFVIAREGDDYIRTGSGYDWLQPGSGNDTVDGGENADGVSYFDDGYEATQAFRGVGVNLTTGTAIDGWGDLDQLIGIEDVYGSTMNDRLTGNAASNYLEGSEGNDTLRGEDGDDFIVGGEGSDLVYGGGGNDFYGLIGETLDDYTIIENADGSKTVIDNNPADGDDGTDTLHDIEYVGLARRGTDDNDQIVSNSGAAILAIGGDGDDVYRLAHPQDHVLERAGEGTDRVEASVSHVLDPNVENLLLTGAADLNGTGNNAANDLTGNTGGNELDGGAGADTLRGGEGGDTYYVDDAGDAVIEIASPGGAPFDGEPGPAAALDIGDEIDKVIASIDYVLTSLVENLELAAAAGAIDGTGNLENNTMRGNDGANLLGGLNGNDTLDGGAGNDRLDGGLGVDQMSGGTGNDIYIANSRSDLAVEGANAGTDLVQFTASSGFTLQANVENLTLLGTDNSTGTGNSLANTITGNSGGNLIRGNDGNDTLGGATGNDTLDGGAGNDRLDGGLGVDQMSGGTGNDIYVANSRSDLAVEGASAGTDLVQFTASSGFTLQANVENLTLLGTDNSTGTGNSLANAISGNSGNNLISGNDGNDTLGGATGNDTLDGGAGNDRLDGGLGVDQMSGGTGNDIYIANSRSDLAVEGASAGTDLVQFTASSGFTLQANVENLTLLGTDNSTGTGNSLANAISGNSGNNLISGNDGNDTLDGGAGNDRLDGGLGVDQMSGGTGNDIYIANSSSDVAIENAGEGADHVQAGGASYTLGLNVEHLTLTGSAGNGTGNSLNNVITGNSIANQLSGGSGNDTLAGGLGNDTLAGGAGNDRFLFDTPLNGSTNVDRISDFNPVADALRLDDVVFKGLPLGTLTSSAFRTGTQAQDSSDRIIYNAGTGAVLFDSDGTGAAAAVRFATLNPGLAITNSDFIVV